MFVNPTSILSDKNRYESEGVLVFLGKHKENGKPRAGIVFKKPVGKNNGTQGGHKYLQYHID